MKVVAFDAKSFRRVKKRRNSEARAEETTVAFTSQLGIGVTIPKPVEFARRYISVSQELGKQFSVDYSTPFFSSTSLRDHLNVLEKADFAKQLISGVQDLIESVHCSFVILPATKIPHIETGGIKCPKVTIPTGRFIEKLAPAFSYMTALGYVWVHEDTALDELEMHIDAFSSKHTLAWNTVKKAPVKIFYKGDECNPFISCADILAFLVDDELSAQKLKLHDNEIRRVLKPYSFNVTTWFFDQTSIAYCTWKMDQTINTSSYVKRPIIFLAIDRLPEDGLDHEQGEPTADESRKASQRVRQTELYQAALKYAYREGGCMKIFNPREDKALVKSGDVFIHAGPDSKSTGRVLQSMADIRVLSGLEAIRSVEKPDKHLAN